MDDKLFALLTREKLRENYRNVPFDKEEVSEDLLPEEEKEDAIEWVRE